jgi:hypothetical protein
MTAVSPFGQSGRPESHQIFECPVFPCAALTDSNNTKVIGFPTETCAAVSGFLLLEPSHVCTFQPDRPGRTV